jgi:hypothetical protein
VCLLIYFIGQGNTRSPSRLPHYYNVLDHFHVTDVWCEKYNGIVRWMVRLEKIDLEGKSWWSAGTASDSPPDFISPKALGLVCSICNVRSKTIYKQGWVCLNADPAREVIGKHKKTTCPAFFDFGNYVDDKTLEFTEEFLLERTQFQGQVTEPLVPQMPNATDKDVIGALAFEESCRKGIVCPRCGCCSRRIYWEKWACENPLCDYTSILTPQTTLASPVVSVSEDSKDQTFVSKSIVSTTLKLESGNSLVVKYDIPGENGEIVGNVFHYKPDTTMNGLPDGPDALFAELQVAALGLKRNASKCRGGKSGGLVTQQEADEQLARNEVLTAHWAHNWVALLSPSPIDLY